MSGLQGFALGLITGVCVVALAVVHSLRREQPPQPVVLSFPERGRG